MSPVRNRTRAQWRATAREHGGGERAMCGIAGEVRFDGGMPDVAAVAAMCDTLARRGPDGSGGWQSGPVALGHRRLKIIDLSDAGAQPMVDPVLGLTVVFNGIIYNYRELRAELQAAGHHFFSTSDTEVVLKAYAEWGSDCVERFLGMFAFVVVERSTGRVVLARDRLGIKPLYVSRGPGRVRFASSLPALVRAGGVDTGIDPGPLPHSLPSPAAARAPPRTPPGAGRRPRAPGPPSGPAGGEPERPSGRRVQGGRGAWAGLWAPGGRGGVL